MVYKVHKQSPKYGKGQLHHNYICYLDSETLHSPTCNNLNGILMRISTAVLLCTLTFDTSPHFSNQGLYRNEISQKWDGDCGMACVRCDNMARGSAVMNVFDT